jgi:hypothetical protein
MFVIAVISNINPQDLQYDFLYSEFLENRTLLSSVYALVQLLIRYTRVLITVEVVSRVYFVTSG